MSERQFKGIWIPVEVIELEIPATAKLLWGDIHSFSNRNDAYFFKSNDRIAEDYHVSKRSVTRSIALLEELGLITVIRQGRQRYCSATLDNLANLGRQKRHTTLDKMSSNASQNVPQRWTKCLHSKTVENNRENTFQKKGVVMPFGEDEFVEMWEVWLQERRDRRYKRYTQRGEQAALHDLKKISNDDYKTAIDIIRQSIAKNWQGLFPITESKQQRPKLDANAALKWANQ
jgi:DNA-binding transcriptional ArsR family regulator